MKTLKKYRNIFLRIMDVIIIATAYFIAEMIIYDRLDIFFSGDIAVYLTIAIAIITYSSILHIFKTYKNITRYENGNDYLVYVLACLLSYAIIMTIKTIFNAYLVEMRINMVAALIIVTALIGYRVVIRLILNTGHDDKVKTDNNRKNVLIIGAGDAARTVIRTIKISMKNTYHIVGLIDDNINKVDYAISGKRILGTRYDIPKVCNKYKIDIIFFTISNISSKDRKEIL